MPNIKLTTGVVCWTPKYENDFQRLSKIIIKERHLVNEQAE